MCNQCMSVWTICRRHALRCMDLFSWWRHQMETFSALLAICAGIHRSPVISPTKASDADLMFSLICVLNKRLSKQWWGWWFKTPSRPLWRHCNAPTISAVVATTFYHQISGNVEATKLCYITVSLKFKRDSLSTQQISVTMPSETTVVASILMTVSRSCGLCHRLYTMLIFLYGVLLTQLPPWQNGHHSGRRHVQIHFREWNPIQMSPKFVPRSPIDNKPALVQVMAWRRTGDKPLHESMLAQFPDAYMRHWGEMS